MIVEYIRYTVPADQAAQFERAYDEAATHLLASPNCLGYDVARCSEEPASYIVRIHWDSSEGHIEGFRRSEHFAPFFALVKPFFAAIAEMRHYDLVGTHPKS
ncbi:MAG TPA: antibiotic biosynthesis monooxygenase family protein [Pseudonocardiaceae bacterium]|nr:antibiotic biosynthesis monooxygenase family protein [Pseudonocardiaceae bacterium]